MTCLVHQGSASASRERKCRASLSGTWPRKLAHAPLKHLALEFAHDFTGVFGGVGADLEGDFGGY
jgi:hypothetical protein